jgi:predicted dienelactone hydrolase
MTAAVSMVGAWLVLFPTPRFPWPTGPHGVGARLYAWTDATRLEPFTPEPGDHRRLVARIWYPTSADGPRQPYIDHDEVTAALARHLHMPSMLLGRLRRAPTHAVQDARPDGGTYPVLVNPTGFSGFQAASLFWIEELVSHGYVVVTLDQPGTAAAFVWTDGAKVPLADKAVFDRYMPLALSVEPDPTPEMNGVPLPGGIIPFLADDLSFTLDQLRALNQVDPVLARTLDLDRVGVLGMSLGGYVAPEACHRDQRFKACLAVDAGKSQVVARDGLRQPLMIISRDANVMRAERAKAGGWPEPEIAHTIASQRALFEHNRADAYYVTMNGMHHVNWTDAPLWSPLVRWTGLAGPIDPYRGFALTNDCARSFFDRYLKQDPTARICGDAAGQPDIRLDTRPIGSGADATSVAPAP